MLLATTKVSHHYPQEVCSMFEKSTDNANESLGGGRTRNEASTPGVKTEKKNTISVAIAINKRKKDA